MKIKLCVLAFLGVIMLQSCGGLSGEAKKIVGNYAVTEISQTEPVLELNRDASCLVRAIKPGVLTFAVEGTWNVKNDSLTIFLDASSIKIDGDSSLIGNIPAHVSRKIVSYTDFSLELESDGVVYYYKKLL